MCVGGTDWAWSKLITQTGLCREAEFTEPWPIRDVGQGRGGCVGGLWAAVGPGGAGTGSGMEERVGLSQAAGQAPSQLLPCQAASRLQFLGHFLPYV